jgi:hypothetical protein
LRFKGNLGEYTNEQSQALKNELSIDIFNAIVLLIVKYRMGKVIS